jgi:hypothetical protein
MSQRTVDAVILFTLSWLRANHPDIEWDVQFYDGCLKIAGQRPPNLNRVIDPNPWQDIESTADLEDFVRQSAYAIVDTLANFPSNAPW